MAHGTRMALGALVVALCASAAGDPLLHASAQGHALPPAARCLQRAQAVTDLLDAQQVRLCTGATSVAPVECFVQATESLLLTDVQGIALCRCATSLAPVECVRRLRSEVRYTDPQMVQMCSAAGTCG